MKYTRIRHMAVMALVALMLVGAFAAGGEGWLHAPAASAQDAAPIPLPPLRTITVVGDGAVTIMPDVARANVGVEVLRPSVEEASAESKQITEAVLAALREQGVAGEDIQTSGYSVYAERYGNEGPLPDDQVQYRVTNSVTVLLRDLDKVGEVLDAAVEAGANNIYGVEFLLEDAKAARSEGRKLAVENARATAEELAALNGVKVGKVLSISEVIGAAGGFYNNQFAQYQVGKGLGGGGSAPIEPGQLKLTMQLQITYELEE